MRALIIISALLITTNVQGQEWLRALEYGAEAMKNVSENPQSYDLADRTLKLVEHKAYDDDERIEEMQDSIKILRLERKLLRQKLKTMRTRERVERKINNLNK